MADIEKTAEMKRQEADKEAGFTLVEVLVTLVIIGLLTTVVVANVLPLIGDSSVKKAKADIAVLQQSLDRYYLDYYDYPEQSAGLEALVEAPAGVDEALYPKGGYIRSLPLDPWGNEYQYRYPGENSVVDIFSYGSDGEPGGEDAAADISNEAL
jgi:general secretion pathway protein G